MAIIVGRNSRIATSTDGATYHDIGKLTSGSLGFAIDIADATTNDSAGFKEGEYADAQASLDATFKFDSSNTSQGQILTEAFTNKTKIYFRVRPKVLAGEKQWVFLATIGDLTLDMSTGEVEEMSLSATSSGAVTISNQ